MTYAQVAFLGGVLLENDQNNGINAILSELLIRGTRTKNQKQIAQAVSGWGGDLGSYSGQNSYGISLSFLSEFHEPAMALLEDILQKPAFPAEEFLKVKKDQLEALLAEKEDIFTHANRELLKGIYQSHPYRLNPLGTEASLGKVTRQDAIDFYETTLDPKRMVVAVFGDIDAKKMRDRLKKSLGVMAAPMASKKEEPAEERIDAVRDIHSTVPRAQAVGMLAFNGVPVTDERRYAYQIINAVMTGSAGRLYQHIRSEHGLSYVVGSGLSVGVDPGYFVMYAAVEPAEAHHVMKLLVQQADSLRSEGITAEELDQAKIQLIGDHEHALESKISLIREAVSDELFGVGLEEIGRYTSKVQKVTLENVRDVLKEFVNVEQSVRLIVGPAATEQPKAPQDDPIAQKTS